MGVGRGHSHMKATGLKWVILNSGKPQDGVELGNRPLAAALLFKSTFLKLPATRNDDGTILQGREVRRRAEARQVDFTPDEWQAFQVAELTVKHYVKLTEGSIGRLFVPVEKIEAMKRDEELLEAAKRGDARDVRVLLNAGAGVNHRDKFRSTPLLHAAAKGQEDVVQLLLEAGADKDAKNLSNDSPLGKAVIKGHARAARMLISAGADINVRDAYGETLLMAAAYNDCAPIATMLLEAGADAGARDKAGGTALMMAASLGHKATIVALLDARADVEARDRQHSSAADYAKLAGHHELAELLQQAADGGGMEQVAAEAKAEARRQRQQRRKEREARGQSANGNRVAAAG